MPPRGSYAKGIAKRQEILRVALEEFARQGYLKTSLRDLANRVNLTQAGVLHYFGSKEELYTEVLRMRDANDREIFAPHGDLVRALMDVMEHNSGVPGLVSMYATMSANAASDPEHPAHQFFQDRYQTMRAELAWNIRSRQREGEVSGAADPDMLAAVLIAAADGLQIQWMLDPSRDMAGHIQHLWALLSSDSTGGE